MRASRSEFDKRLAPFDKVVAKALQRDSQKRYQSASEMRVALDRAAAQFGKEQGLEPRESRADAPTTIGKGAKSREPKKPGPHAKGPSTWDKVMARSAVAVMVVVLLGAAFKMAYDQSPEFRANADVARDKVKSLLDENKSPGKTPTPKSTALFVDGYTPDADVNAAPLIMTAGWAVDEAKKLPFELAYNQEMLTRPTITTGYNADVLSVGVPKIAVGSTGVPYPEDTLTNVCTLKKRTVGGRQVPAAGVYLVLRGKLGESEGSVNKLTVDPARQTWGTDKASIILTRAGCQPSKWPTTALAGQGATADETRSATFVIPKTKSDDRALFGILGVTPAGRTILMPFASSWSASTNCSSAQVCIRETPIK